MREQIGVIATAEYGLVHDMPFLMGLRLGFKGEAWGVGDGGKWTVNMSDCCKWPSYAERREALEKVADFVYELLSQAKVNSIVDLVGTPVAVKFAGSTFEGFRVLTECLL